MRLIRFLVNATKYTDGHQRSNEAWLLALEDVVSSNPLARPSFDDVVFPIGSDHSSAAAAAEMVKRRRRFQSDKDIDDGEALSCGCGRPTRTAATPPPPTSLHSSRSAWRLSMPPFLLISAWLPAWRALVSPSRLSSLYMCLARRDTSTRPTLQPTLSCQASSER